MSKSIQQYIQQRIEERKAEDNFRSLKITNNLLDFYSNDYLGFASNSNLKHAIELELKNNATYKIGSTGSRLLSGNSLYIQNLETHIAEFHKAEAALIFNSGFDANYGLISCLPYRGDTIIYDELVHASIHDGIRNSKANSVSFLHNNISDLETKLQLASGLKYVIIESIYSMDGDCALLQEIVELCQKYDAGLIVDEAHATGIWGKNGEGKVVELGLQNKVLARIHTFGKALGVHGAAIVSDTNLKHFLINYCRPFIFSTSLPFHTLASIQCAYQVLPHVTNMRNQLFKIIDVFKNSILENPNFQLLPSNSPIQSILISGNRNVKEVAAKIQAQGFDVRPILYPTVAKGKERIRICLHTFNTEQEVTRLVTLINSI